MSSFKLSVFALVAAAAASFVFAQGRTLGSSGPPPGRLAPEAAPDSGGAEQRAAQRTGDGGLRLSSEPAPTHDMRGMDTDRAARARHD